MVKYLVLSNGNLATAEVETVRHQDLEVASIDEIVKAHSLGSVQNLYARIDTRIECVRTPTKRYDVTYTGLDCRGDFVYKSVHRNVSAPTQAHAVSGVLKLYCTGRYDVAGEF